MLKHFSSFTGDWAMTQSKKVNKSKNRGALKMCKKCYTFYYKNSWHFEKPKQLEGGEGEPVVSICFTECPACLEEEMSSYNMETVSA